MIDSQLSILKEHNMLKIDIQIVKSQISKLLERQMVELVSAH